MTVESRAEPEGETVLLSQPAGRLDMKPTEVKMDARQPRTLPESEKQLFATRGHGYTCYPSASDVRLNHPGVRPSWTLRAPGHEGTRCWYAGTPTATDERRSEMAPGKETIGTTERLESSDTLFGVQ
jgi:hypothetical protein